jgi:nickel-dependent lactate racemase
LPEPIRASIVNRVHDPANRDSLSYLAAGADARPIYVSREIHDADLVISIGVLRLPASLGYYGINSAVMPAFSDSTSAKRFHSPRATGPSRQKKLRRLADEVGWLLGLQFTIQVVPGAAEEILHIVAGELEAVGREGGRLCEAAWSFSVPERAGLVIATIEGDARQQTWENVARALAAASQARGEDGAIVVCTELAEPLGPALRQIAGAEDLQSAKRELSRTRSADVVEAAQIVRALEKGKVYLLSGLSDESVEELGILPLAADDVSRVARRYRTCTVLANAHHAQARVEESSVAKPAARGNSR